MKRGNMRCLLSVLALSMIVSFCGCRSGNQGAIGSQDQERLQEIVQEFVNDIQYDIIPAKDDLDKLKMLGFPVSKDDSSYGMDALYAFYDEYESGGDAAVNLIFASGSIVVTRIVFEDGKGYYLRYQYDSRATGPLDVTTRIIDSAELTTDARLDKVELALYGNKTQVALFTFKNVSADTAGGE